MWPDTKTSCFCAGCGRNRREWVPSSPRLDCYQACKKCGSHTISLTQTKPRKRVGRWAQDKAWRRMRRTVLRMKHAFMPWTQSEHFDY